MNHDREPEPTPRFPEVEIPPGAEEEEGLPELEEVVFEPKPPVRVTSQTSAEPTVSLEAPLPEPRYLSRRRFATLAAFAEALIPRGGEIPHSASDVGVAVRIDASLGTIDRRARRILERLLTYWEWRSLFSRKTGRFSRLPPVKRAAVLERARRSRSLLRRQAFEVLKLYCLNHWASTRPVEQAIGFTYSCVSSDPPRDGPQLEVLHYPQIGADHVEECDAVVIGSGAGGSVVAKELAEVGLSVVVLEEGGYYTRKDFTGPPWDRYQRFYRQSGTTVALGTPTIPLPLGKAIGGTTLINSGTCFRTPDRVLERWGRQGGIEGIDPEAMRPFFARVERIQGVMPVPEELLGDNARVFRRGVQALGLHGEPINRNIRGCRGCGVCAFGCPSDAKQSTHLTYLPIAQRNGATIYAHCRAERIVVEDGRARGVVASLLDPQTGEPRATLTVRSKVVVVAAGTIHTPAVLARNGLGNRSGQLGRNLRIHPAAGVGAFFREEIFGWRGTLQPFYVDDWHESDDIMIEVTSPLPSISGGSLPGTGVPVKDVLARARQMCTAGLLVADTSSGRVIPRGGGEPVILYRLNRVDARKIARGLVRIAEIMLAAGADTVFTGLPGAGIVSKKEELERVKEEAVRPRALKLTAFHPVGTARMGADPGATVVDPWGEAHGVPGLFVADGSVMPGCPAVNPQITIMGFATRTADHIVRHGGRYFA